MASDINTAISYFNQAIARDPGYALAYSGLADAYGVLPSFSGNPSEAFPKSNAADVTVTSSTSCPTGAPKGAFCGSYTLVVPASNPIVGTFAAGKTTITSPATGDVLYTVEADATNPASDATMCSPSSQTTSKDATAMPLKVTAGATTTAAELDFTGCS